MNALEEKIDAINTSVSGLPDTLDSKFNTLAGKVDAVKSDVANVGGKVDGVKSDVAETAKSTELSVLNNSLSVEIKKSYLEFPLFFLVFFVINSKELAKKEWKKIIFHFWMILMI